LHQEFQVHLLNEQGIAKAQSLATVFDDTLTELETLCGTQGRYMSLVRTKLEEASFFAKKAIAVIPENQKV
jgi:hypothetical protein